MIAKRAARRNDSRSSFRALAAYLLDAEHGGTKVALTWVTNCHADTPALAIKEIEATQALNQRTKADKTYHLVVSFRAGERPSEAQLRDIEREVCAALGFGEHQRLSALHTDTNHRHLHLAINKIHPRTLNCVQPYRDFYTLSEACLVLEVKHGLAHDHRIGQSSGRTSGRSADMESHAGIESFQSWVQGEPARALAEVLERPDAVWDDLHRALARHDLELHARGAGLVIAHRSAPLFVRASGVARRLGRGVLEQRLGPFQPPGLAARDVQAERSYRKAPVHTHAARERLHRAYRDERQEMLAGKREVLDALVREREQRLAEIRTRYGARRLEILRDGLIGRRTKRGLYAGLRNQRLAELRVLREEMARRRAAVHRERSVLTWQAWLVARAEAGDEAALAVLRSRRQRTAQGVGQAIVPGTGAEVRPDRLFTGLRYQVHANGDVTYRLGNGTSVRDEGQQVHLADAEASAVEVALRIAQQRFGPVLDIQGSDSFRRQVVDVAANRGLAVRFSDPEIERQRQARVRAMTASAPADALDAYVAERLAMRRTVPDILEHRRFHQSDAGTLLYQGQRTLSDGSCITLYRNGNVILVAPVTHAEARRLPRPRIGSLVEVDRDGRMHTGLER